MAGRDKLRILVVEDEEILRRMLAYILRDHEVTAVTDGKAGLHLVSEGGDFDVILSDVSMPGMDGVSFYRALAASNADVAARVVFCWGGSGDPAITEFFRTIHNPVVAKPFTAKSIAVAVEQSLQMTSPTSP